MKIFIGNLSRAVRADDLRKLFEGFGTLLDAKVANDVSCDKALVYGNVYIVPDEAAREAIDELQLAPLKGYPIEVRECHFRASGERRINKRSRADAERRRRSDRRHEPDVEPRWVSFT